MAPNKDSENSVERLAYYLGMKKNGPAAASLATGLPLLFLIFGLVVAYYLPFFDANIPGGAPVTQIFLEWIWFGLMYFGLLGCKEKYRQRYGELAYQKIAVRFFIPAGILMFAGIFRAIWVQGEMLPQIPCWLRIVLGIYFLIVGMLLEYRGVHAMGIDRVVFVYTVFPERGRQVESSLYKFLRHPLYTALAHMALGITLLSGRVEGFFCFLIFFFKLWSWSKIEEKDLTKRFGESYKQYMKEVPAFIPKIKKLKEFLKTLILVSIFIISAIPLAHAQPLADISRLVEERYPHLEKVYRHLHQYPELSLHEEQSSKLLAAELFSLGFDVTTAVGHYGVVAVLKNGDGPVVMIRTDMDALPVEEKTGAAYASKIPNVMHACGHDIHMSVFLGTAYALTQLKDRWHGTLLMIAQPAEEVGQGAKAMMAAGLFQKFPKPDYALAIHDSGDLFSGTLGYRSGFSLANVDSVDITIFGKGGHGAMPHKTIDPIVLASQVVLGLQTLVSREIKPTDDVVLTVGSIHGGTKHNIIPDSVALQLTIRSYEESVRNQLKDGIIRITEGLAATARAPKPEIKFSDGVPALYNDPELVSKLLPVMEEVVGKKNIFESEKQMVGEDFAMFRREGKFPIFMMGVGAQPKNKKEMSSLHSSHFLPDYPLTIKTGVTLMTQAILTLQSKHHPLQSAQRSN